MNYTVSLLILLTREECTSLQLDWNYTLSILLYILLTNCIRAPN